MDKKLSEQEDDFVIEDAAGELSPELESRFGKAVIKFKYRVNAFTPELEESLSGDEDLLLYKTENRLEYIRSLVAEWNVKRKKSDAEYAPVDIATLKSIPHQLLTGMMKAINENSGPNEESEQTP